MQNKRLSEFLDVTAKKIESGWVKMNRRSSMEKLLGIALLCLSFGNQFAENVPLYNYDQVYSLDESTQIMRSLIKNDNLSKIMLPDQASYLDFYINNYSPSYLAFEAEVSAHRNPVLVICCNNQELIILEPVCRTLMARYPGLKIISVNDETLPSIVAMLKVTVLPAFIFIDQRTELGRVEGTVNVEDDFEALLSRLGI